MSSLRFFNTLGRREEAFTPIEDGRVRLYTCGPTVYDHAHIGNLRTFLFEDLLRRALGALGYQVTQVMNLTDVDDKTIRGAQERGESLSDYTAGYIESFFEDLTTLRIERAEFYPRATEHISGMIDLVQRLLDRGAAYEADGSVFFRIASDADYGKLSGIDLQRVQRGQRVASDEYEKEDLRDFVLWKAAKPDEPAWDSPWGRGRPGWHIECSAMSMEYLGETLDIHCGGVDNIFPHHENEIAQTESATDRPFVRYWLHSEHLIVDGEKMSKSLGNFYTLKELLARGLEPRALRYLFLSVHYRQKLNFTWDALAAAEGALRRLDELRFRLENARESDTRSDKGPGSLAEAITELRHAFRDALCDDLNMAEGLGALFSFVKKVNVAIEAGRLGPGDRHRVLEVLGEVDEVLAVIDPEPWRRDATDAGLSDAEIDQLVVSRDAARAHKDWPEADRIRDELAAHGIVLEDTPGGSRWKRS